MKAKHYISLILRIIIAVIFLQTLFYKFTAAPESVKLFTALGLEPYGRIGLGIVELITSILILVPRTKLIGIVLSFGIILGAIGSHLLVIGVNFNGDGGRLFELAIIVFVASLILIYMYFNAIKALVFRDK